MDDLNDDVISQIIKYLDYSSMINFLNSCKRLKNTESQEIFSSIYSVMKHLATKEVKMLTRAYTSPATNFNYYLRFTSIKFQAGEIFIKAESNLSFLFYLNPKRSRKSHIQCDKENLKVNITEIRNISLESVNWTEYHDYFSLQWNLPSKYMCCVSFIKNFSPKSRTIDEYSQYLTIDKLRRLSGDVGAKMDIFGVNFLCGMDGGGRLD